MNAMVMTCASLLALGAIFVVVAVVVWRTRRSRTAVLETAGWGACAWLLLASGSLRSLVDEPRRDAIERLGVLALVGVVVMFFFSHRLRR